MTQFVLIICQVEDYRNILKLSYRPLAFTSYKVFLKNKKRSWISLPVLFSALFLEKNISIVIFCYLTKFHCLVPFTCWNIGPYMYCNCLLTRLWRLYFEINLAFLIKPLFPHDQNIKTKVKISWERKKLLDEIKSIFHHF